MDIDPQTLAAAVGALTALPVMLLRNRKPRTLRPKWLWVAPLLIVTVVGLMLWTELHANAVLDGSSLIITARGIRR